MDRFRKHVIKNYPRGTFYYNMHESGYGDCGFPDIYLKLPNIAESIHVEAKRYSTAQKAENGLRHTQIATIVRLLKSGSVVFLLYATGCALGSWASTKIEWQHMQDFEEFDAIDTAIFKMGETE